VNYTDTTSDSLTITSDGISSFTLTSGKTISTVQFFISGTVSGFIENIDFIAITSNIYLDLGAKVRGIRTRRTLGWDISQATITVQDEGGFYWTSPNIITPGDVLILYAKNKVADSYTRLFGGPVNNLSKSSKTGMRRTDIVALGWDKALDGTQVFAYYGGQTDTAMVNDIISKINTAQVSPSIQGWHLAQEAGFAGPLDPTTVTLNERQATATRALTELSDYSSIIITGAFGTDFLVTPSELFRYKKITLLGDQGTFSDTDWTELNLDFHIHDVKSAVTILGSFEMPQDGDAWTESTDVWTNVAGTHAFTNTGLQGAIGTNQLVLSGGTQVVATKTTFSAALDFTKIGSQLNPPTLSFSHAGTNATVNQPILNVFLFTSTGNYFQTTPPINVVGALSAANSLVPLSLPLGPYAGNAGNNTPIWTITGAPNWNNITFLEISWQTGTGGNASQLALDGLHFAGTAGETAVDGRTGKGEAQFGRRELVVFDTHPKPITGTPGIRETAHAELLKWRDPISSGYVIFHGNLGNSPVISTMGFNPGDIIELTSTHYNYSAKQFRITAVSHEWTTPDPSIQTTLEVTDFMSNTMSRQPGDVFQEIMKWDAVSRGDQVLQLYRSQIAYQGVVPTVTQYNT